MRVFGGAPVTFKCFSDTFVDIFFDKEVFIFFGEHGAKGIKVLLVFFDIVIEFAVDLGFDGGYLFAVVFGEEGEEKVTGSLDAFESEAIAICGFIDAIFCADEAICHMSDIEGFGLEVHVTHMWEQVIREDIENGWYFFEFGEGGDISECGMLGVYILCIMYGG